MSAARVVSQRMHPAGPKSAVLERGLRAPANDWQQLRPRGVGELLDQTFRVYVRYFGLLVGFGAACFIPLHLFFDAVVQPMLVKQGWVLFSGLLRDTLPALVTSAFVTLFIGAKLLGQPSRAGAHVARALLELPGLVMLLALVLVTCAVLGCFLLAPGVLAVWLLTPALAVYLLEARPRARERRRRGLRSWPLSSLKQALTRSWRLSLSFDSLGRYFGVGSMSLILILLPLYMISSLARDPELRANLMSLGSLGPGLAQFCMLLLGAVSLAAIVVFFDILMTLHFFDLRVRREALDLEIELQALEHRGAKR